MVCSVLHELEIEMSIVDKAKSWYCCGTRRIRVWTYSNRSKLKGQQRQTGAEQNRRTDETWRVRGRVAAPDWYKKGNLENRRTSLKSEQVSPSVSKSPTKATGEGISSLLPPTQACSNRGHYCCKLFVFVRFGTISSLQKNFFFSFFFFPKTKLPSI